MSTDSKKTSDQLRSIQRANLGWLNPPLKEEEFWNLVGISSPCASCLVGPGGEVLAANRNFEQLVRPLLRSQKRPILLEEAFLPSEVLRLYFPRKPHEPCSVRLRDYRPVLVYTLPVQWNGHACKVLHIWLDREGELLENQLKERIQKDRERVFEAVKCTLRVYELHEKVRRIPALTRELLQIGDEDLLYEEAGRILRQDGMGLKEVTFLVLQGQYLVTKFSTNADMQGCRFPLDGDSKYAYLFRRGGSAIDPWTGGVFVLPLRGREKLIGLMEVTINEETKKAFSENHKISLTVYDSLLTVADIIALLVESIRLYQKLKLRSQTDPLTGLFNRSYLVKELQKEVNRARRFRRPLSLLFVDVDNLKELNDKLGHLHVDIILNELAKLLKKTFRKTDCVSRYGGDEFVILLPETDSKGAETKGQELCKTVSNHDFPSFSQGKEPVKLSVSCGAVSYREDMSLSDFLELGDRALYKAKKEGKNRVCIVLKSEA